MRDAAAMTGIVKTARLMRGLDAGEVVRRNALTTKLKPNLTLVAGTVVTVVETLGAGEAFLVEFNNGGKAKKDACDWMGVLYPAEIEIVTTSVPKG